MRPGSAPEVRAPDEVVAEQLRRRSAEDDAPGLHHVAAVGHPEGEVGVLLDHEHRGPAPPDVGDDPERRLDERGGQPERRLVEQDEPRPRVGASRPETARSVDVLPAPLAPITQTSSPGYTTRSRPRRTATGPYAAWRSSRLSNGARSDTAIDGPQVGADDVRVRLDRG